jgi:hypothetical protein
MNLKFGENNLTIVINTLICIEYPYRGASYALHKLAFELANRGQYVYIFNEPLFPHENIMQIKSNQTQTDTNTFSYTWDAFEFNIYKTVAIYPQTSWGNMFQIPNVARWVLHDCGDFELQSFRDSDLVFNYGDFSIPKKIHNEKLTVFDYKLDLFINKHLENRKGFAHILNKNTPDWGVEFVKKFGSSEIVNWYGKKSVDYLVDEFNKYEYVLTFDNKSYLTTAAALCGTKAIILNEDKDITPYSYRIKNPIQMFGVAYGLNDLSWADKTIGLVRNHIIELEKEDQFSVDNFLNIWMKKIYNN